MAEKTIVTPEGLKKLQDELYDLKANKRGQIAERIKEARSFGDLSENSEYDAACEEHAKNEARILFLEEQLKNIEVYDSVTDGNIVSVQIGLSVRVYDCDAEEELTYTIVGLNESDTSAGKISDRSPLGSALVGHGVGETVRVFAPGGEFDYKILEIFR